MNHGSIVTELESRGNLEGPINNLFDVELLLVVVLLVKLAPQVPFLTMLHYQVVVVIMLLIINVPEQKVIENR